MSTAKINPAAVRLRVAENRHAAPRGYRPEAGEVRECSACGRVRGWLAACGFTCEQCGESAFRILNPALYRALPLTQGMFAVVDAADYADVGRFRWSYNSASRVPYRIVNLGRIGGKVRYRTLLLHREILGLPQTGASSVVVDHVNRDPLDNRRDNMRICSPGENNRNRARVPGVQKPYRGVVRRGTKRRGYRWIASMSFGGVTVKLGRFDTPEEASAVYERACGALIANDLRRPAA